MDDPAVFLEAGVKAMLYASVLVAIGASAARWLLLRRAVAELGADRILAIEQSVARAALMAASFALAASGLRVWTHAVSAFGFHDALSWDTLKLIALHSGWSHGWKPQGIAALILMLACAAGARHRAFWPLATLATLVFTATIPLLGHAAGSGGRVALHALHILASGVWLGTLAVILFVPIPAASLGSAGLLLTSGGIRLLILRRFSPIALSSAVSVVAAGLVVAWLYLGALSNLWSTAYGRVLLLKSALVAGVVICGYANWQRLRRLREDAESSAWIIVLEATLAATVVIVTGFLTEIGHP